MPKVIPLSALQHYLFCPRQCALIHNEQVWAENRFTAEGQVLHKKANEGPDEHRAEGSVLRHLHVASKQYNISGICDIVEISTGGEVTPVEYKRGKPKSHRADEVQLCAQALCLEEMLETTVSEGLIFYGKTRRRKQFPIDDELRELTVKIIQDTAKIFLTGETPNAQYCEHKCPHCSLIDLCMPHAMRLKRGAKSWFETQLKSNPDSTPKDS
jgi:CRISPR-associated exonuclease Cas4